MGLDDPNGGLVYGYGKKFPSTHASTIANQQPKAVDGGYGGLLTTDANQTIDFANGTTYRTTATLTQDRYIDLPMLGNGPAERFYLRTDGAGAFDWIVRELGGNDVAKLDATLDAVCAYWDGSNWRCLLWSGTTFVDQ